MAAFRTPPGAALRSADTSPVAPATGLGARLLRWRSLCGLLLAVGVLSMQAGRGTLAYFTSEAASTGNWFMTGKVLLNLTDANETESPSITASFGSGSFRPGDTATGYIVVQNSGSSTFHYGLKYTATNTTGTLWVAGGTNPTLQIYAAGAVANCTQSNVVGAKVGLTSIYGAAGVSTTPDTVIFDSVGASKRQLTASSTEILCFAVRWPDGGAGSENGQMGADGTIALGFDAR